MKTFEEYVEQELLLKHTGTDNPYEFQLKSADVYHSFRSKEALIMEEVYKRFKGEKWFYEQKMEVREIVRLSIAYNMYLDSIRPIALKTIEPVERESEQTRSTEKGQNVKN
jgi:hypothetical protein